MMSELRELIRYANIALGVTIPTLVVGAILLRNAGEGVLQGFGLAIFFLGFAILLGLDERAKRRRRRRGQ
jgi:hypothetical protein